MKEKLFNLFLFVGTGFGLVVPEILQRPVAGDAGAGSPDCVTHLTRISVIYVSIVPSASHPRISRCSV
jgi:hypothetical protein